MNKDFTDYAYCLNCKNFKTKKSENGGDICWCRHINSIYTKDSALRNGYHTCANFDSLLSVKSVKSVFSCIGKLQSELEKSIVGEKSLIKCLILLMGSKYVINKNPLSFHTLLNSKSGSGKDFILGTMIKMFEENKDYENFTRISSRALDYLHTNEPEFSWNDKFLVLHDIDDNILNSSTLKLFLTEGTKTAIVNDGKVKSREVRGKPVVLMTSAYSDPGKEQLRRINILNLDETKEQTKRIMLRKAQQVTQEVNYKKLNKILFELIPSRVKIDFAEQIATKLSEEDVFMRTFFDKILDFIKSSCVLNQYERKRDNEYLIAEAEDYNNAKFLIENLSTGINFKPMSHNKKDKLDQLKHEFGVSEWFRLKDVQTICGINYSSAYDLINSFLQDGFIEFKSMKDEYSNKNVNNYRLKEVQKMQLPSFREITDNIDTINNTDNTDNTDR